MKNKSKRWLLSCLLFFIAGCSDKQPDVQEAVSPAANPPDQQAAYRLIHTSADSIRTGDMIVRTGNDFTSFCLRQFCQFNKTYSHCGIASIENDSLFVYHSLGGEFNPDQKLLRDPLLLFASPYANTGFGVFRFTMNDEQGKVLLAQVKDAHKRGVEFDMDFDLASDNKMYCSEFTAKMYRLAMGNDTMFAPSKIAAFSFLAPDNLFTHPLCRPVFAASFKSGMQAAQ